MRKVIICFLLLFLTTISMAADELRLPVSEYRDRMEAGWLGQIAGVSWGAPTEFRWVGELIPVEDVPVWDDSMMNSAFGQDDLYVEMTFLRSLEKYGFDVTWKQAGIDFANSEYGLWCANRAGRENLRKGIAPPDSGHPQFSKNSDDIDYQIEADYAGLIAPGMPNIMLELGDRFGRMMNYGDGLYGGHFMGGMYTAAFYEKDMMKIIEAGLACIPAESLYAQMVRDMLRWHQENPDDWEATWKLMNEKWFVDPKAHPYSGAGIDVKINGAAVLLGLLYGQSDPDRTIVISMRAGYDSDCDPSSAAGVLFTMLGKENLPARFKQPIQRDVKFWHTDYTFNELLAICEKLTRQAVIRSGGRIEKDVSGQEIFIIPQTAPQVKPVEQSWAPGPIAGSVYAENERAQIKIADEMTRAFAKVAPGFKLTDCGPDMDAPCYIYHWGRQDILVTHPLVRGVPSILSKNISLPKNQRSYLVLSVGHHERGDWELVVKVNGKVQRTQDVDAVNAPDGWMEVTVDLTPFAGADAFVELLNQPTDWMCEAGYWEKIEVITE